MNFVSYIVKTAIGIISVLLGIALAASIFWWGDSLGLNFRQVYYTIGALFGVGGWYICKCAGNEYDDHLDELDHMEPQ